MSVVEFCLGASGIAVLSGLLGFVIGVSRQRARLEEVEDRLEKEIRKGEALRSLNSEPDSLDSAEVSRLRDALVWLGYSAPEPMEESCASWVDLTRDLIDAVLARKEWLVGISIPTDEIADCRKAFEDVFPPPGLIVWRSEIADYAEANGVLTSPGVRMYRRKWAAWRACWAHLQDEIHRINLQALADAEFEEWAREDR